MTKPKTARRTSSGQTAECPELRPEEMLPFSTVMKLDRWEIELAKLNEIARLLFLGNSETEDQKNAQITRALEIYERLAPVDAAEGMLAEQMVGTHFAAIECLRRAALPKQTFEARDMALRHATRLMKLYSDQLAALGKYRGKGQQKVTVEHVHVHSGGQAIVGSVETGKSAESAKSPTLEDAPEPPVDPDPRKATMRRARGKTE